MNVKNNPTAVIKEKAPRIVPMGNTPQLHISEEVNNKIKYICSKISNVEWSGVLVYKSEGDLNDINNLSMKVIDIYVMDIGSSAHTSFEYDPIDIATAFEQNPDWIENEYRLGLIHSHVNMGVFFSGTDISELQDNAKNYDYYLSLITNNMNQFVAKIAFVGEEEIVTKKKLSIFNSIKGILKSKEYDEEINKEEVVFTCNVDIDKEGFTVNFNDIDSRINSIKSKKEEEAKKRVHSSYKSTNLGYQKKLNFPDHKTYRTYYKDDDIDIPAPKSELLPFNEYSKDELGLFFKYMLLGKTGSLEEAKKRSVDSIVTEITQTIPGRPYEQEQFLFNLIDGSYKKEGTKTIMYDKFFELYKVLPSDPTSILMLDEFLDKFTDYFEEYLYDETVMESPAFDWLQLLEALLSDLTTEDRFVWN